MFMKNFTLVLVVFLSIFSNTFARKKETFVLVHGAFGGGWAWKKVDSLLTKKNQIVYRVTLTGLGERSHLINNTITLETHIQDVINTILFENLHNVVLLGHSYGGAVIAGVMDRIPERIGRVIFVDAHFPKNGESIYDYFSPEHAANFSKMKKGNVLEPSWLKPNAPYPFDVPHPENTLSEKIVLTNPKRLLIPGTYIIAVENAQKPEADSFYTQYNYAKSLGYKLVVLQADHNPQVSMPEKFYKLLLN
jgi:hypothetical protein